MSRAASLLARLIWGSILWLMRRPVMRRARRWSWEIWPEPLRSRVRNSVIQQDAWALRHGLKLLRWMCTFLLAMIVIGLVTWICLALQDAGIFTLPERYRR